MTFDDYDEMINAAHDAVEDEFKARTGRGFTTPESIAIEENLDRLLGSFDGVEIEGK